jgi:hypothetical protein
VFVYDTTKDSDGGAWRNTTQGTSWYNETLNTTTRGATKQFPAVAVLVLKQDQLIIYDGDDPSMPMWMVFNNGYNNMVALGSGYYYTTVAMLNGELVVGHDDGARAGLDRVYFIKDEGIHYGNTNTNAVLGSAKYKGTIEQRNDALSNVLAGIPAISSNRVYDVKMTVLPSAPIDTYTGLPVPTIAVGTNSNVNIIRDDGTVFQVNYGSHDDDDLAFNEDWTLMMVGRHADRSFKTYIGGNEFVNEVHGGNNTQRIGSVDIKAGTGAALGNDQSSASTTNSIKWMFGQGFSRLKVNTDNFSDSMVCGTSDVYTSGWLVGDIKGAFLADTDDTNVTGGTEYVASGSFDDAAQWTATDGSTISGGVLTVADGTINETIYNSGGTAFPAGKQAIVTFTISNSSANFGVRLCTCRTGNGAIISTQGGTYYTADGTYTVTSLISDTHDWVIGFQRIGSHTGTLQIDNVSVKLAEPDRSYRNDGLLINGTITKDPVATGAELVGYSGFSPTNYLQQEYNSDLDFGTGDFCVMGWVQESAASDWIVDRMEGRDGSSNLWGFNIWQSTQSLRFDVYENNANTSVVSTTAMGNDDSVWYFFTAVRRNGVLEMYMQGSLEATTSGTARNISYTSTGNAPPLIIGGRNTVPVGSSWLNGKAALIRISATAPTAEQIAKIYNDEKHLFKENAKCTNYGTAKNVTALAYDEDTELLHVGTNSGRSMFRGLQRVDNTTDGVGVAISASNDLVVEE